MFLLQNTATRNSFTEGRSQYGKVCQQNRCKNVQDKNGQNVQQSAGSETETGRDTGLLEDVSRCSGDNNNCWTADNVDDVKKL